MNPEQALQILKNVANLGITKGGIFQSVDEAASVSMAIQVLSGAIEPAAEPKGKK
jgi:hypothetical protein